uniref:Putative ATP-dependent RNA helicase YTHDC2 n=1 Tax=Noccaea caerulescens TaxID=107243 RepID=A0A1J3JM66_NOCCA
MGKKKQLRGQDMESIRIWASKFLRDFRASGQDAHDFDSSLSNTERGIIHQMCRQMGMGSKSSGSGDQRCLTIFRREAKSSVLDRRNGKRDGKGGDKQSSKEKLKCVSFPPEAKPVLQELFTRYPPCDGDTTGTSLGIYTGHVGSQRKWKDDFFSKPQLNKEDILNKVASLSSRLANDKDFREILKARKKLPITSFRDAITSAVESNQVVLIAGETGCGKTTQVPQYLLDHMWYSKREACKIICTQPRRISAISVSERIAWERGETIGNNVGYKVRLQSKGGRQSSVVFCTNGILLRVLVGKGSGSCVPEITHIIVDEIHERDCYSDFMLAIIRDFLPSNPHLRLILMSATLDAERFSGYFGGCPVVRVPGFTYPVRTFYLDDVLSVLKSDKNNHLFFADSNITDGKRDFKDEDKVALDEAIDLAWTNDEFDALLDLVSSEGTPEIYNYRHSSTWLTPLMVLAGKGKASSVCKLLSFGADCQLKSKEGMTALELAEKENQSEAAQILKEHADNFQSNSQRAQDLLDKYMATSNPEEVDVGLIAHLLRKICGDSEVGAVLVFLPGWEEISKTKERLLASPYFADSAKFRIICLHSRVPAEEQKKVFNRPPRGCRKIVLATNIAESAITIDDVVYVIDSGRMKEKSYDPYNDVSTLQSSWVSKANAKQREGRAGRCQPGICYHLYSKLRAASLPEFRVPEVRRMPVDELCLQVKMLDPSCNVNYFLQKLMDPPVDQSIANALTTLKDIGALTPQEELTELGQKFGQLPVHPRISKMLYFAILVNCLDPALILACAADTKDPFTMPLMPGERKKAAAAKLELAALYGGHSDHLATVAAFHCWKNAKVSGQAQEFCSQYFVSPNAMKMLDNMRDKLQAELKRHGLIPSNDSNCSLNAHDPGILRAVLAVGLYPMVGRMCPPSMNNRRSLVETVTGAKVRVLSNHLNMSSSKGDDEGLIVFDEITRGDWDVHIRSCTALPTIHLLLFSGEIAVAPTESCDADKSDDEEDHEVENVMDIDKAAGGPGEKIMLAPENSVKVVVDRWLAFEITAFEIAQMYVLRERLVASILFKVKHPQEKLPPHLGTSMYAIACILSYDGLPKTSAQTVAVEPIASTVDATGLRDDIPSAKNAPSTTTPMGSKLKSVNTSGLGNTEETLSSNLANGNAQPDPNTAPTEQKKKKQSKSKKCKSVDNVDLGNIEENPPSDMANENEETDPNTTAASEVKEPEKKRTRSKKRKSTNNLDLGNMEMEDNTPYDLVNGNEEESIPGNLASAAEQPKKKKSKSKRRKLNDKLDSGDNMEENMASTKPMGMSNL